MADSKTIIITLDGTEYRLRAKDITALDAKRFRAKVGVSLLSAFDGSPDLDHIAGLVWLVQSKTDPALAYETVAKSINYDSDLNLQEVKQNGQEDADPET